MFLFFASPRMKKAVQLAKDGKCRFAYAEMRNELRFFLRQGREPSESKPYKETAKRVRESCGSSLGGAKRKRRKK